MWLLLVVFFALSFVLYLDLPANLAGWEICGVDLCIGKAALEGLHDKSKVALLNALCRCTDDIGRCTGRGDRSLQWACSTTSRTRRTLTVVCGRYVYGAVCAYGTGYCGAWNGWVYGGDLRRDPLAWRRRL